jgi:lipopolysaccharide export LptBFGC system permease protein LptF
MRGQNRGPARLTLLIAVLASLAYLGGGIALIASSQSFGVFPEPGVLRYSMAVMLIAYGTFRIFRAYQQIRNET